MVKPGENPIFMDGEEEMFEAIREHVSPWVMDDAKGDSAQR